MSENKDKRQPYEKPVLHRIELTSEEVMAVGCKIAQGGQAALNTRSCVGVLWCPRPGS